MTSDAFPKAESAPEPRVHVSLDGGRSDGGDRPSDSVQAALEEAMQALEAATGSSAQERFGNDADENSKSRERFQVVQQMAEALSRREATACLVQYLAGAAGVSAVRCGIGKSKLHALLDHQLGWLGPESLLFQEAAARWSDAAEDAGEEESPRAVTRASTSEINFPQPSGGGRCTVWIEGERSPSSMVEHSPAYIEALGALLWSRPAYSWPTVAVRMARRSSYSFALAGIALISLAVWPVSYRVPCAARVETTHQRMVSTPFEAKLLKTHVRPGDQVAAGEVLVELDGRPLRLEREAIEAELQQVVKEQDVALATKRIADAQQASLKEQHLRRQHDMLSDRLQQLEVVSPIEGVVVSGDLEKLVDAPLERGQTLLEIAPMEAMVIEVEIPEHEIGYVTSGAMTRVKLDAIGGESIRLPLHEVYPSAELRDDRNVFVGRIQIDNQDQRLSSGYARRRDDLRTAATMDLVLDPRADRADAMVDRVLVIIKADLLGSKLPDTASAIGNRT